MIPLAIPRNGELVNLSQIVRVRIHEAGRCDECEVDFGMDNIVHVVGQQPPCTIYFSDGRTAIYTDEASRIINAELHFAINQYRAYQMAVTSSIVDADGQPAASRLM